MSSARPSLAMVIARKVPVMLLGLICLGAVGSSVYFYQQLKAVRQDPQQRSEADMQKLVAEVGELLVLPEGEDPTVATVSDVEKLRDQAFFAHAKDGDRVLLYTNAKKAILYDPEAHKIVEVAPINIGPDDGAAAVTPEPEVAGETTEASDVATPTTP